MAFLQAQGNIEPGEMARTFNCGIGMVLIVARDDVKNVMQELENSGETAFEIGELVAGPRGCTVSGSAETWFAHDGWSATFHG
jgi:phosphoribosylformylglycinamidine cyclo-ligase